MREGAVRVKKNRNSWYRMDSAASLYASLQSEKYSATYRFSALMTDPVDPAALQRAIDRVMPRFPSFSVRVRHGFFWHYLESNPAPGPFLKEDLSDPCQPFRFHEDNHWLIRFYYYRQRISIEIFHALSDGAGAMIFFRTLLAAYLREKGHSISPGEGILDVDSSPSREELEDAYSRYAGRHAIRRSRVPRAYDNAGTAEPFYTFHVTMGFLPLDRLHSLARRYQVSVTEYLTAVLISVILDRQRQSPHNRKRPVSIAVPVNLRSHFPTQTLNNFITTVSPYIDPAMGDYTFEEILRQVHNYMKLHITHQEMQSTFTRNVRLTTNPFLRAIPLFLKTPILAKSYKIQGVRPYSGTYTNVGPFSVPDSMRPHIQRMEVILGQAIVPRSHCASISYGNTLEITFAGTQKETDTEREFFRFLVRQGIPVQIESNR